MTEQDKTADELTRLWESGRLVKLIAHDLEMTIGQVVGLRRRLGLMPRRYSRAYQRRLVMIRKGLRRA